MSLSVRLETVKEILARSNEDILIHSGPESLVCSGRKSYDSLSRCVGHFDPLEKLFLKISPRSYRFDPFLRR